jgi:hypothetical protein
LGECLPRAAPRLNLGKRPRTREAIPTRRISGIHQSMDANPPFVLMSD